MAEAATADAPSDTTSDASVPAQAQLSDYQQRMRQKFAEKEAAEAAERKRKEEETAAKAAEEARLAAEAEAARKAAEEAAKGAERKAAEEAKEAQRRAIAEAKAAEERAKAEEEAKKREEAMKTCHLQVKLLDGSYMRCKFDSALPLSHVVEHINAHRGDGDEAFRLVQSYPQRIFTEGDMSATLRDLDLAPRSALTLMPMSTSTAVASSAELGQYAAPPPVATSMPRRPPPPAAPKAAPAAATKESFPGMTTLKIVLMDGTDIQMEFAGDQTLGEVRMMVDVMRTDGGAKYKLAVPYPRHVFEDAEMSATLAACGLVPRSALVLLPDDGDSPRAKAAWARERDDPHPAAPRGWVGWGLAAAGGILGAAMRIVAPGGGDGPEGGGARDDLASVPDPPAQSAGRHDSQSRVAGLHHRGGMNQAPDDGSNEYWNGNSVAFSGGVGDRASSAADLVDRLIGEHPVVMFSEAGCQSCKEAKDALREARADMSKVFMMELDDRVDGPEIQAHLKKLTGSSSAPLIFIGGKCIGGGPEIVALGERRDLRAKLVAVGAA